MRDDQRNDVQRRDVREDVPNDDAQMRMNPEVQGRTEPLDLPGRREGPGVTPADTASRSDEMEMWPDMRRYKGRMAEIHSMFIDDPRKAVQEAERLIDEMVDYVAKSMHEQVRRWHKDVEGNADTEKLRLMMREFSQMMERFERRRAA